MVAVESTSYSAAIVAGDGLVARFGDVAVFLADARAPVAGLIDAVKAAAGAADPGAKLFEGLAPLAVSAAAAGVSFGAAAPTRAGLVVLVRGRVTAEFDTAQGARRLSGERAVTWVDEVLPATASQVSVWCAQGSSAAAEWPHTDLHRGVVPGGGFILRRADKGQDMVSAMQTIVHAANVVGGQATKDPSSRTKGAPVAFSTPHRGDVQETSTAGAMNGVLVSDDGALYPLDRSYVIGRDPLLDETVRTAVATPIALQGDSHISRIHAYVSVDKGAVRVRDASTPSGTFIAAPGATEWTAIATSPTDLPPGWSVRVGARIFTYRGEVSG